MPEKLKMLLKVWCVYDVLSMIIPGALFIGYLMNLSQGDLPTFLAVEFMLIFLAVFGILVAYLIYLVNVLKGKSKNTTALKVMAGLNCLSIPIGLVLGVVTFVVLADKQVSKYLGKGK